MHSWCIHDNLLFTLFNFLSVLLKFKMYWFHGASHGGSWCIFWTCALTYITTIVDLTRQRTSQINWRGPARPTPSILYVCHKQQLSYSTYLYRLRFLLSCSLPAARSRVIRHRASPYFRANLRHWPLHRVYMTTRHINLTITADLSIKLVLLYC